MLKKSQKMLSDSVRPFVEVMLDGDRSDVATFNSNAKHEGIQEYRTTNHHTRFPA